MYKNVWPSHCRSCQWRSVPSIRLLHPLNLALGFGLELSALWSVGRGHLVRLCPPVRGEASASPSCVSAATSMRHGPHLSDGRPKRRRRNRMGAEPQRSFSWFPLSLTPKAVCAHLGHLRGLGCALASLSSWEFGSGGVGRASCSGAQRGPSLCRWWGLCLVSDSPQGDFSLF